MSHVDSTAYTTMHCNCSQDACVYCVNLVCRRTYPPTLPNYVVSDLPPVVDGSSDLDSRVPITVTLTNSGPSSLPSVSLNIFLPLRNPTNTGEFYYLYPLDVNVSCGTNLPGEGGGGEG